LASPALTGPSSDTDTTTTVGSVFTINTSAITSGRALDIEQTTSAFTGTTVYVNVATGFSGNFLNFLVNSVSKFSVNSAGGIASTGGAAFSGTVTAGAASATTGLPRLNQVTAYLTITSGALPTISAASLATGTQVSTTRQTTLYIAATFTPGAAASATVTVALSPDNVTYTTLIVETVPQGVALDGFVRMLTVVVPQNWYVQVTPNAQASIAASVYA
jgi:hypothetical protein